MAVKTNNHAMLARRARELQEKQRRLDEESDSDSSTDTEDDKETPIAKPIAKLIHETKRHHMGDACRRNCRNKIEQMTEFWKESNNAPNIHVAKVVREVPLDEHNVESNWFHAN